MFRDCRPDGPGCSAITGLIDRLETAGFVVRHRCEKDRRVIFIEITDVALKLLKRLDEPVEQLHQSVLGHLTRAELKELIRLLEKTRTSLATDQPEP